MSMSVKRILLAGVCAGTLCACAGQTPLPQLQPTDVPKAFEQPIAAGAPIWPSADWWRGFGSPELDTLIASVEAENLTLLAAEQRVLAADARVRQAGAALLPSVNGGVDASRRGSSSPGTSLDSSDSFGLSLSASYELDFWGRNRDALLAAEAARKATAADRETVALSTVAGTANTYFQLLSARARLTVARLNLENARAVLDITQARVNGGVATPLELAQQLGTLAGQEAAIPQLEQQELAARDALAVLTGRPPEGFTVAAQDLERLAAPAVAPGLPSELLVRRPDIVTAEANLEAAHADLAAARAALFPSITLTGNGGLQSTSLAKLLTDPSATLSFGASLAQTVFDAGSLQAQTVQARARELELLANYRNTVIGAFSQVETALGNIGHLARQEAFQIEQANQSQRAFDILQARYREGVADFLTVLDAQRTLYQSRDQLNQTRLARLQALVALYQALGGGWRAEDLDDELAAK